jgi:hypothetical protein
VAFNAYVQSQLDGLAARGCHTTELKVNLFKGYKAVKDDNFLAYLQVIQNADEDGTVPMDASLLMLKAVNFYKNKLTRNEWEQQSESKKDLLALRTEVNTLKKGQGKARKAGSESTKNNAESKGKKPRPKGQRKAQVSEKPEKPTWLEQHIKPKSDAIKKSREWNNVIWYWCSEETNGKCGGKWRTHKLQDCKGLAAKAPRTKVKKEKKAGKRKADALRVATANQALLSDQDSSDYDS